MRTLVLSSVVVLSGCTAGMNAYDGPVDGLEGSFRAAADETGVPRDLLVAIAWNESHLDARDGIPDELGHVGIMGLRIAETEDQGPTLDEAAFLLGVDANAVRRDEELQISGAAEILASWARRDQGGLPEDLADWWPIIAEYSGSDDPQVADAYASGIYHTLESGFIRRVGRDERIELEGRFVPGIGGLVDWRASTDYSGAHGFVPAASCNYTNGSRTRGDIRYVVIHTTEGSYSGSMSWFQNCNAGSSAHYIVRSSDGEVSQLVDEEDNAWHAGNSSYNWASIGIEHEAYMNDSSWFTDNMYRQSAKLTADICDRYGIPKDRAHIIGHDEVPDPDGTGYGGSNNHTDPGDHWDWNYYLTLVNGEAPPELQDPHGDLIGMVRAGDIYTGTGIAGATVRLSDGQVTTTDSTGRYRFYALDEGSWTVEVTANGYTGQSNSKWIVADVLNWDSFALVGNGNGNNNGGGTQVSGAPEAATGLSTSQGSDSVKMTWTDHGATSDYHEVEVYFKNHGTWTYYYTWTTASQNKTFWPQVRNTTYSFHVRGKNDQGFGPWSNTVEFAVR